jgi:hypothetical protein
MVLEAIVLTLAISSVCTVITKNLWSFSEILSYHSKIGEDSSLLGRYAPSIGKQKCTYVSEDVADSISKFQAAQKQ